MGEKIKRIGESRTFLNESYLTSLTSHIAYTVSVHVWDDELIALDLFNRSEIEFSISDCSKNIFLEFNIETKEQMRNSLHKLDTIINTCQAMRKDLKEARLLILEGQKKLKEIKK